MQSQSVLLLQVPAFKNTSLKLRHEAQHVQMASWILTLSQQMSKHTSQDAQSI